MTDKEIMGKESEIINAHIQERLRIDSAKHQQKKFQDEFAAFDVSSLRSMPKKELTAWQARYPPDSPQYIAATQEWQRKNTNKNIAWGIIGGIIVAIVGALLASTQKRTPPPQTKEVSTTNQGHRTSPMVVKGNVPNLATSSQPRSPETKKPLPNTERGIK